jgi:hypothetical protein
VGCASGYLMETLVSWCHERGHTIEPYGLDISPELADLARCRLPHWAERIFTGNAIDWLPPPACEKPGMRRHLCQTPRV